MKTLTRTQQEVFEYIKSEYNKKGIPPSVREIGEAVGLRSTSSVQYNLDILEDKGYIERDVNLNRTIRISTDGSKTNILPVVERYNFDKTILSTGQAKTYTYMPVSKDVDAIVYEIKDNSMVGVNICKGDKLAIEITKEISNGDIVLIYVNEELKIKKVYQTKEGIRLQSENDRRRDIVLGDYEIIGKVISVYRDI